jgi:hypothetical protein
LNSKLGSGQTNGEREAGEEQSEDHAHNFFDIKGIVHKQFVLAGQTGNSAYYCEVLW